MTNIYLANNQFLVQTPLLIDPTSINALEQALSLVQQQLQLFANDPEFSQKIGLVFGEESVIETGLNEGDSQGNDSYDSLREAWLNNDFSILANIEIVTADELGAAMKLIKQAYLLSYTKEPIIYWLRRPRAIR